MPVLWLMVVRVLGLVVRVLGLVVAMVGLVVAIAGLMVVIVVVIVRIVVRVVVRVVVAIRRLVVAMVRLVVVRVLLRFAVVIVSIMLRVDVMEVAVAMWHGWGQVWLVHLHLHLFGCLIHRDRAAADQCFSSVGKVISTRVTNTVERDGLAHNIVVTGQVLQQVALCKCLRRSASIVRAD